MRGYQAFRSVSDFSESGFQSYKGGVGLVKKKVEKPQREVTRRQLSRWQQQEKRRRIILGVGIAIVATVVVTVGVGWYTKDYKPLHQTVIRINDAEFNMDYYVKMLKFYAEGQPTQYMQLLANSLVIDIERNELVRQGAEKLGITVGDDAVDEELKSRDPPLSKDYRDWVRAEMLINRLRAEYFDQQVPVFAEQRHIMAMFLESESRADELRIRLENGEDFAELAGELSLESYSKLEEGDLGWHPEDVFTILLGDSIVSDYAFDAEEEVLSPPIYDEARTKNVGYWIIRILEQKEDSDEIRVHAILLGSAEEAHMVKDRLEAGEDFAELAGEFSQHGSKESGGDLGWLTPGMVSPGFDDFVFSHIVGVGELSDPVHDETIMTTGGYWLVKILDIDDDKKIEEEDRDMLKAKALNEWVASLWDDPENEVDDSELTDERKEWAIQKAMGGLR